MTSSDKILMEQVFSALSQVGELRKDFKKLDDRIARLEGNEVVMNLIHEEHTRMKNRVNTLSVKLNYAPVEAEQMLEV